MITFDGELNLSFDDYEVRRVIVGLSMYADDMKQKGDDIVANLSDDEVERKMAFNEADSFYSMHSDVNKLISKIMQKVETEKDGHATNDTALSDWN